MDMERKRNNNLTNVWQLKNKGYYDRDDSLDCKNKNNRLSDIAKLQTSLYPCSTITILAVGIGRELKYLNTDNIKIIVGIDANAKELEVCKQDYSHLSEHLILLHNHFEDSKISLPSTEMVIANIFIEKVGEAIFLVLLEQIKPKYVSCLLQNLAKQHKLQRYPYGTNYPPIDDETERIKENHFIHKMKGLGYHLIKRELYEDKYEYFIRLDFHKQMKANIILETERLYLREMTMSDFIEIAQILQNKEVMYAYEHAFSDQEVFVWINKQIQRYKEDGYGLWAMIEKKSGKLIGQCGITKQQLNDQEVLEIGYLLNQSYWHQGYASEAANACKMYGFTHLNVEILYSIIRDNNIASINVAKRNGMKEITSIVKRYYGMELLHCVYGVRKGEIYD